MTSQERHISIHALREEGDGFVFHGADVAQLFLSTPSARRATYYTGALPEPQKGISIHALREEGDLPGRAYGLIYNISIHALREEGDC